MTNKSSLRKKPKRKEMSDKERVRDFQRKLYRKAKQERVSGKVNSTTREPLINWSKSTE